MQDQKIQLSKKRTLNPIKNKIILGVLIVLATLIGILVIDFTVAFGRFEVDRYKSSYSKSISDPNTLTIVYRPDCERCRRVLPSLFLRKAFSSGKEYILDARTLTPEQKQNLGERSTPTFVYKNQSVGTVDESTIYDIWDRSHKKE